MIEKIKDWLNKEGIDGDVSFVENLAFGDISTNAAMIAAAKEKKNPKALAEEYAEKLRAAKPDFIADISVAGPGFINFTLADESVAHALSHLDAPGYSRSGEKVMVEYTDANLFKEFHIGHFMSNAIGESISRLIEHEGADVRRASYQGDVGLHVAKCVAWALKENPQWDTAKDLGTSYASGAKLYEADEEFKKFVVETNKKIYSRADDTVNAWYDKGRTLSLSYFNGIYEMLGTHFDHFFFESVSAPIGLELVKKNIGTIFSESDGAVVFKGEERDPKLHTRVFVNSEGLPTYEAKELGLVELKREAFPLETSVVITANEQKDYFRVLLAAIEEVHPETKGKNVHIAHGMLRLPSGKMSSRTGDVVTAVSLIADVADKAEEIMNASGRAQGRELAEAVAVGAIKFSILRQAPGKDVIFDINTSVSFEGDSGPYLMYSHARANSILEKAEAAGIAAAMETIPEKGRELARLLARFPSIATRAAKELAPHMVVEYLLTIAGAFNSWYAAEQIVSDEPGASSRVALALAFKQALSEGLSLLAIPAPEKM